MVVDLTDNLDSLVSKYACKDAEIMANSFRDYVRATYKINIMQKSLSNDNKDSSIEAALDYIHNHLDEYKTEFKVILNNLIRDNELDKETDDETSLGEMLQYFDEADYFNKYVYIMEKSNLGTSQYKYLREFLDAVSMKNSASKLLADGRSRRHPRRGALGSKLLETLVQIPVLNDNVGTPVTRVNINIKSAPPNISSIFRDMPVNFWCMNPVYIFAKMKSIEVQNK